MKIEKKVYIIKLKVEKKGISAMEQIKDRKYYEKYIDNKNEIYLIGMEFDEEIKNLGKFEGEKIL